jgi:hypothetical protein
MSIAALVTRRSRRNSSIALSRLVQSISTRTGKIAPAMALMLEVDTPFMRGVQGAVEESLARQFANPRRAYFGVSFSSRLVGGHCEAAQSDLLGLVIRSLPG